MVYLPTLLLHPDCAKFADSNWIFNKKSISITGLSEMAYGAYLGILIQARYFRHIEWPDLLKTTMPKFFLRYIIVIVLLVPFGLIFILLPSNSNLAVMIIFKTLVPVVLMMFCLFAFANFFFVKFHLVNDAQSCLLPIDQQVKTSQL